MGHFYVTEKGLLVTHGYCADSDEAAQGRAGQVVISGLPPGFAKGSTPYPGARWHLSDRAWVDTRNTRAKNDAIVDELLTARRLAYPPLTDLADALYWQANGDPKPMADYLAAVDAVKAKHPKKET